MRGTWTKDDRITIIGDVHIELDAGSDVIITKGIQCAEGNTLTITGTGGLTITTPDSGNAGIGGNDDEAVGTINIEGGDIIAKGGDHGAGIGGGNGGDGGEITISGGDISATGNNYGAGIGGGSHADGGTINIEGGTITKAEGSPSSAGIGGGAGGHGGTITISGDTIIESAQGGGYGAGIGGGEQGNGGTINIIGGEITATGGVSGAGIGGGYSGDGSSAVGEITISGNATITATSGNTGSGISGGAGIGGGGSGGGGGKIDISGNATIRATGGTNNSDQGGAGIGGGDSGSSGEINIHGNAIITEATGAYPGGAGIGGGYSGSSDEINIYGEATIESAVGGGKSNTSGGAGIGGGAGSDGGEIDINGNVKITEAQGGEYAAGIGGGDHGDGGTIIIRGATIEALGGYFAAGIGGGAYEDGGEINISGHAKILSAQGGTGGAGIGGGYIGGGGTIEIEGGEIESLGGYNGGAGIGGGASGNGGEITITSGDITATGDGGGAGIGGGKKDEELGGDAGTILIESGTISAEGGVGAAGVGVGNGGAGGTVQITGGSINATSTITAIYPVPTDGESSVYLNTLTVPEEFEEALVTRYYQSDYGLDDVYTDTDATLYFYLPATFGAELIALSFDEELDGTEDYYGKSYARGTSANTETLPYLQLDTPEAEIDFTYELLTGLIPETDYDISVPLEEFSLKPLSSTLADDSGIIEIDESWIGSDIEIILRSDGVPYGDSEAQVLEIPDRLPVSSELAALIQTAPESEGASGKVSGLKVGMAYSTDPNAAPDEWISVDSEDDLELAPGAYYFRKAATGDTFATDYITIVIPGYQKPVVPNEPADPDSSAEPLGLAGTGVNLDLAYLLVLLLLAFGTVLKKRVIPAHTVIPLKKGI